MDAEHIIDLTMDAQVLSDVVVKRENDISQNENVTQEEFIIIKNPDYEENDNHEDRGSAVKQEVLPPPLTLDDPVPLRSAKRRGGNKNKSRNLNVDSYIGNLMDLTLPNVESNRTINQRFRRSCKDKIVSYNDFMFDVNVTEENQQQTLSTKEHSCDLCGASFEKLTGLKRHKNMKHKIPFTSSDLAQNLSFEHNTADDIKPELSVNQLTNSQEIQKSTLEQITVTEEDPKPDLGKVKLKKQVKKSFPCPECGKIFSLSCNLSRHLHIHRGTAPRYKCTQCGKLCTSKQGLRGHIRFIHTGERPFKCSKCPKAFVTNSDLTRHQSKHSDIRKYKCSDCGKEFKQRAALFQHVQRKLKQKTWYCELCPKSFTTKSGLKCHMVVHTKIKLFECESCQRQFSHRVSLEAHVRVHTGVMPYICSVCGKKFAHLSNRNRHMRQMHQ